MIVCIWSVPKIFEQILWVTLGTYRVRTASDFLVVLPLVHFAAVVVIVVALCVSDLIMLSVTQYGPVFSFTMVGKTFTYLVGSDAAALLFNSKNENLNAEEVYGKLTTPVFGKGVAYDVPNPVRAADFLIC